MITSYEELHYDVLNLGRQEAWMGLETLEAIMDTTDKTEFVSANLINVKTGKPVAKPYVIKDYGTMRVGLLGLLNEADFPPSSTLLDSTKLRVQPHLEAVKKYLPSLARKVDAVIVLSELPTAAIDSMSKMYPDIDLVISTGALRDGEKPAKVGKTNIVGPGSSGYNGHYAMLEFNPAWKDSVAFTNAMDPLTDTYEEPGEWTQRLAAFGTSSVQNAAPLQSGGKPNLGVTPGNQPTTIPIQTSPSTTPSAVPTGKPTSTQPGHEGHAHG